MTTKREYNKIKRLKKQADKLWKIKVMERYGKVCTICPKPASDPHHAFPKGSFSNLRYALDNGVPLCRNHHMAIHHRSDPTVMIKIIHRRGIVWYKDLERRSKEPSKYKSAKYYREIIELLQL